MFDFAIVKNCNICLLWVWAHIPERKQHGCSSEGETIGVGDNCWPSQCVSLTAVVHTLNINHIVHIIGEKVLECNWIKYNVYVGAIPWAHRAFGSSLKWNIKTVEAYFACSLRHFGFRFDKTQSIYQLVPISTCSSSNPQQNAFHHKTMMIMMMNMTAAVERDAERPVCMVATDSSLPMYYYLRSYVELSVLNAHWSDENNKWKN